MTRLGRSHNSFKSIPFHQFFLSTVATPPTDLRTDAFQLDPSAFDTQNFVDRLESQGFSRDQAEVIITQLNEVMNGCLQDLRHQMVTKTEQGKTIHSYRLDFAHLKSEIHLLEKNDFAILKQENERIATEVEKLKQKMREDLQRMHAGVRLDMNLDKARIRDEQSVVQMKIKETETKMEQEVAQLRASIENVRIDTIKTIGGESVL